MSFKSELKELQKNLTDKLQKIEAEYAPLPGHDDSNSYRRGAALNEYNNQLKELKTKYAIQ